MQLPSKEGQPRDASSQIRESISKGSTVNKILTNQKIYVKTSNEQ